MCNDKIWTNLIDKYDLSDDAAIVLNDIIENEEIIDRVINKAMDEILKSNNYYIKNFESDRDKFKYSIKQHITWMIKDLDRPKKIDFERYNQYTLHDKRPVYCYFYKILSKDKYICNLNNKIIKALNAYFYGFSKMYCD